MPAGDKRDPFSGVRKWLKIWARYLRDPAYVQLSPEARGTLFDLRMFSLDTSETPGLFLLPGERPMPVESMIRGCQPRDVDAAAVVGVALQELRVAGFVVYDEMEGYSLARWADEQDKTIVEPDAARRKRIGDATRKRNQRAKDRGEGQPIHIQRGRAVE